MFFVFAYKGGSLDGLGEPLLKHRAPLSWKVPKCFGTIRLSSSEDRSKISPGSKGWRSGESARLPPMWPGFKSRRRRHMWVEFVVGSLLCSERFFSGYSGFPLSSKTNISKFQFDEESCRRRTSFWMS